MDKQPSQRKPGGFFEGKGFYIALFLCVAAIGISGYYLFSGLFPQSTGASAPETVATVSGQAEMEGEEDASPTADPSAADTPSPSGADTGGKTAAAPSEGADPAAAPDREKAASTAYVWPVQGEVQRDFSLEVFAYDANPMYKTTAYGVNVYSYLVIVDKSAAAPTAASAKSNVSQITAEAVVLEQTYDVNASNNVDINDAQLVYDMYKGAYSDFTAVTVEKFLRADVNGSKTINVQDASAIVNEIQ